MARVHSRNHKSSGDDDAPMTGLDALVAAAQPEDDHGYAISEIAERMGCHPATALGYMTKLVASGKARKGRAHRTSPSGRTMIVPVYELIPGKDT